MRQALGPITPRACANTAELAFLREKKSGKKSLALDLEWIRTGSDPLTDHCLHHQASGALAASSGLQIGLLYCSLQSVSVETMGNL